MITFNRAVVHCRTETNVTDCLGEAKLAQLHAWAVGLAADGNDELRAAREAILLLIEVIDARTSTSMPSHRRSSIS